MWEQTSSSLILQWAVLVITFTPTCNSHSTSIHLNEFAGKINQHLFPLDQKSTVQTLVWSPLSVFLTLDPLVDAAGGPTLKELDAILHVPITSKKREISKSNSAINSLSNSDEDGNASNQKAENSTIPSNREPEVPPTKAQSVNTATGFFISNEYKLNEIFLKKLQSKSNAVGDILEKVDVKSLDLTSSPMILAKRVNTWINHTTDGLIEEIITPDSFNNETKMIVVNGVQFKGKWKSKFRRAETETQIFHGSDGPKSIQMMFQRSTEDFKKFKTDGFQALKLSYADSDMKLLFILPNETSAIPSIVKSLTPSKLGQVIEQLEPTELDIYVPKFRVESNVPIKNALMKAGLLTIFSKTEANLTRMLNLNFPSTGKNETTNSSSDPVSVYLGDIVHKTVFEMDEEGTKAGAATAGFIIPLSGLMNRKIRNFTLDRPFIFIIRDAKSSTVFQGVVTNIPDPVESVSLPEKSNNSSPKPIEINSRSNANTRDKANVMTTDSPWWIHKGTPEYLEADEIDSALNGNTGENTGPTIVSKGKENHMEAMSNDTLDNKEILYEIGKNKSSPSSKVRFQQPEPVNAEGIRFPHPLSTNVSDGVYQSHSKNKTQHLTYHGLKISNALRLNKPKNTNAGRSTT